ncbi:hypothetical protein [Pararhizobium sp. LjRoot238]
MTYTIDRTIAGMPFDVVVEKTKAALGSAACIRALNAGFAADAAE